MSDEKTEIEVYTTRTFDRVYDRLSDDNQEVVDNEIEEIIKNPKIGQQKKGDLQHLRVHKFSLEDSQILLGYHFNDKALEVYLMYLGPHENFYRDAKQRRKADLKIIK
ncbi:type II toxin-antitoxin system RelE/ParE family toxin [Alkalimarinus coralli]|uniref:type II toxin-antitoxin system RelE/ParE family toxin n=1 Tax=Alkalimarinus coralli TaxID=2935863 RepID=UPI00202AE12F|nr:type II toxin-antitoxin system RelE/ParE family toxin [Alkalimarinus coralli]